MLFVNKYANFYLQKVYIEKSCLCDFTKPILVDKVKQMKFIALSKNKDDVMRLC